MGFQGADQLFNTYKAPDKNKFISQEFQDFGYQLAIKLDDLKHKSLYMRLAKNEKLRSKIEAALRFVRDAQNAKNKAALFMWKLQQLKEEEKKKIETAKQKEQSAADQKPEETPPTQTALY
jgi:hypothetical protein